MASHAVSAWATAVWRLDEAELRFGDWGPGYLSRLPSAAFGLLVLRPGDAFPNHLHRLHTETFVVLEGEVTLWLDRSGPALLAAGDLVHAEPGVEHLLRNDSDALARALFVKSPWLADDKEDVDWSPAARSTADA